MHVVRMQKCGPCPVPHMSIQYPVCNPVSNVWYIIINIDNFQTNHWTKCYIIFDMYMHIAYLMTVATSWLYSNSNKIVLWMSFSKAVDHWSYLSIYFIVIVCKIEFQLLYFHRSLPSSSSWKFKVVFWLNLLSFMSEFRLPTTNSTVVVCCKLLHIRCSIGKTFSNRKSYS